jgi:hypothetical protein
MTFNWEVSVGDIIAFISLLGSVVVFGLTSKEQRRTKDFAQNANAYNDSAKKYYDLMVEQIKAEKYNISDSNLIAKNKKAYCDANIVKIGSNKWILKIFNKGNANATDVSFKYLVDNAPTYLTSNDKAFPIKLLEPQKNVDYHLIIHMGLSSESWDYEIMWTNEDGTTDSKKGILTLPLS